ncbi:ScbR family autoregulator-binding transcription factor [Streptomyces sp. NPDC050658]|uniref:ScbR family autoregulator-binding transcription factor n=1 Tax=unclassified Streptomyces TaxID=2593676 RepID=UPI003429B114
MVQQERAARTREALMRAAAEAFAEDGFVPTTLSAISKKAGVSNGALHFHFENKDVLARAVEAAAVDAVRRITRPAAQPAAQPAEEPAPEPGGEAAGSALQELVDATHRLMSHLEHDVVVRAGFELLGTAARRRHAADLRGEWQQWITAVLHTARRRGELAHGVTPDQAAAAVTAATVGFEVLGVKDPTWVSHRTLSQYWELMLPRLAAPDRLPALSPHGPAPHPH